MRYFDLHCDTPYRMYHERLTLESPLLDCSLTALASFEQAVQAAAIWSDRRNTPEQNYADFFRIADYFRNEIEKHADICALSTDFRFDAEHRVHYILTVEGGDLLCGKLSRLDRLYAEGVRIFTPTWKGTNCIGGAHDTDEGLTPFGKEVIRRCDELGITVDVSHMSDRSFADTAAVTSRFIASHSDSRAVFAASRNLTDEQFQIIRNRGGLVGLNWYPPFVSDAKRGDFSALCRHALHFLSCGGAEVVCLGADRDGIPHEDGYTPLSFVMSFYTALSDAGVDKKTIRAIFFDNAARYFGSEKGKDCEIINTIC